MVSYEPLRGMQDYYADEAQKIRKVETIFREVVEKAGYSEAITPVVEEFELFSVKGGEELRKTMYVFKDKGDREVALRPEITPSIVRLYLNSLQHFPKPLRIFYVGRVYRYDEPQLGRYREFRQAGVEVLGTESILAELEMFHLLNDFYRKIGLKDNVEFKINNIGIYRKIFDYIKIDDNLQEHVLHLLDKGKINEFYSTLERIPIQNSKIMDLLEILTENGKSVKIEELIAYIDKIDIPELKIEIEKISLISDVLSSLGINYLIDLSFVRGLAYYTGPIFEVTKKGLPFSIAGGGRYDSLVEIYGGSKTPAIGFAIGIERTVHALENILLRKEPGHLIAVITLDNLAIKKALEIASILRENGYVTTLNNKDLSLSKLISLYADQGYTHVIIIGKKELENEKVTVRNLKTREQRLVNISELIRVLNSDTQAN
ncbi:MAG: histidine--tRNA ligase [Metallosphaera sp.]